VAVVLAFLAAVAFALGSVLQQKGTLETEADENDPRFLLQILRRPAWLGGVVGQAAGWILQAVALGHGSLLVVQSITALSVVIALPFGVLITSQQVNRRVVLGAVAMAAGIVLFLSVGAPKGGTQDPSAAAWWSAGACSAAAIVIMFALARHRSGATRALLLGSAAGLCYALQAAVTKVFVEHLGHGIVALLTSWTVYGLIVTALVGFVLQQSALKTGVLAPAMGSSNAVTLFASVLYGLTVFGETLARGDGRLLPAIAGLAVAILGIVLLSGSQPPPSSSALPDPSAAGQRVDPAVD